VKRDMMKKPDNTHIEESCKASL